MSSVRVKEKLPQYLQVRDIMNRPVVSSQALDVASVGDSSVAQGQGAHGFRGGRSVSTPFPTMEVRSIYGYRSMCILPNFDHKFSTALQSPGLQYSESPMQSPMQGASHNNGRQQVQAPYRYYPLPPQPAPPRPSYPQVQYSLGLGPTDPSSSSHGPLFPGLPPPVLSQPPPPLHIPQYNPPRSHVRHISRSVVFLWNFLTDWFAKGPDSQDPRSPLNPLATDDQRPQSRSSSRNSQTPPPSPPLTQTLFQMFRALESRKRQREEEYMSLKRMKLEHKEIQKQREERERQRWHEREMLRLQIQLEKYKREGPDPQLTAGEDTQYHAGESSGLQGTSGAPATSIEHPHSALQQHSHIQHTLESHERGGERPEHESHHTRLGGIDIGGHTTHHSHLQQQQPPQQQQPHQHHVLHGSEALGGPLSSGDAALDALTSLREGSSSGGLR